MNLLAFAYEPRYRQISCACAGCGADRWCLDCACCRQHCRCAAVAQAAERLGLWDWYVEEQLARWRFRQRLAKSVETKRAGVHVDAGSGWPMRSRQGFHWLD